MAPNNPSTMSANPAGSKPISVLFVCLGNICRSPMAEAIFRHQISTPSALKFSTIDSAGTGAYHVNSQPDPRTMSTLRHHGITSYTHAARKIRRDDFFAFDYILAMDGDNLDDLLHEKRRAMDRGKGGKRDGDGDGQVATVRLMGDFLADGSVVEKVGGGEEVGDPYYGGKEGFEVVYRQLVRLSGGFLKFLERQSEVEN
ncbi:phosphotyrosine protein phosphatase [Blastomyces parvus]|uniref:Phosphotyrosine protein phosphatase n=1 Tax=Blastomyces parvus TaxID=2060905 RepID=A0A2B7WF54_9EURO|nr:phosphotyrosine protein phosphatase [Blastomyces parvus]